MDESEYHVNADKTLVLKGKIIDTIKALIVPPEGHSVFFETLLDTGHKFEMNIGVLKSRYKQFESFINFHKRCLVQLRGLMRLPNDADPFGVHWRLCFMDDTADLPIHMRTLTLQYAELIKLNMTCVKDTIRLVKLGSRKGFQAIFRLLHYYTLDASLKRRYKTIENFNHESGEAFLKAQRNLSGRCFCVTEDENVGWVAMGAQQGNRICVFEDSNAPFVIKEVKDGRTGYKLSGDCYLHGQMSENLFETSKIEVEDICLV